MKHFCHLLCAHRFGPIVSQLVGLYVCVSVCLSCVGDEGSHLKTKRRDVDLKLSISARRQGCANCANLFLNTDFEVLSFQTYRSPVLTVLALKVFSLRENNC